MREQGEKLFQQYGCVTCHVTDRQGRCPSLLNVFGHPVVLDDGRTVLADEAYVRESILNPNAKIVKGYNRDIMPVFQGQIGEDGLLQLIAYIKSLSPPTPRSAKAAPPAPSKEFQMSTTLPFAQTETRPNYLNVDYGWKSWLFTTDHKRIALLYLFSITAFFFVGGAFAVGMRVEPADAGGSLRSRHLQQAVHHARDHHGVLLSGSVDPRNAGQFPDADHDRRPRPRVSANQSC